MNNPIFHQDGSITYWRDSYGWYHRVHPSIVPKKLVQEWRAQDRKKWEKAMVKRGFVKRNNIWVPYHDLKEV